MLCAILFSLLLGELAVSSHAVHNFRTTETRRAGASRGELSRTGATRASTELSSMSEADFQASALAHASMFGHAFFDMDAVLSGEAGTHGRTSMFGQEGSKVIEGSERSDPSGEAGPSDDGDVAGAEEEEEDDGPRGVTSTLSPEERVQAHQSKYEAEFVVELNMTEAHETGQKLGLVLNRDADFMAATVFRIQKTGLVEDWNRKHPDMAVLLGDEIVRVNDVQWHANTETFITRIAGQFKAGRKQKEGYAEAHGDTLKLYVQRPRVWKHKRFDGQREDAHKLDYAAEFVSCVPMPDELKNTMDDVMGWKLSITEEWKPPIIRKIERHGAVPVWNKNHPDKLILEGDEILQLDNVIFHHNATQWMKVVKKRYRAAKDVQSVNRSALISIRRPRPIQEAFDEAHPVKDILTWRRPQHSVQITFPEAGMTSLLGWQIKPSPESDVGNTPTLISRIRPGGLVERYNREHPDAIAEGDLIVEVNGVSWTAYDQAKDFYDVVEETLKASARKGPQGDPVNLLLQRPTTLVKKVRMDMEHGVHMGWKVTESTTTTELPPMFSPDGQALTGANDQVVGAGEDDDDDVVGAEGDGAAIEP